MAEQEESQRPCVMCRESNEQMLMLSCVHDPCVNCAAVQYVENEPQNSPSYNCAKCGQRTQLDSSSVAELLRIYSLQKNKKRYRGQVSTVSQKDRAQNKNKNDLSSASVQPYSPAVNKATGYQITYPCKDHQDEQLTYFCFTCHRPICPQCAIHGLHKDHEVETTRKAIKQIKQLLLQDKKTLDSEIDVLARCRDDAKKLSKEWVDENKRDQEYIRKRLAQLKSVIAEKEKELIISTEVNLERNCQIFRNQAASSEKAIQGIVGVKKEIQNTLNKQQLTVLQEYTKREAQANNAVHFADQEREKIREQQTKNPLKALNLDLFDSTLDGIIAGIQSVKLTVSNSTQ